MRAEFIGKTSTGFVTGRIYTIETACKMVKRCKGAHLILSDWKYVGARYSDGDYMDPYDKESWELTGAKMVVVDGEKIKEDTYYRCIEGEIVEVTEDGEIVEE